MSNKYTTFEKQDKYFYSFMGPFFADRSIIKEMDSQLYNGEKTTWHVCADSKTLEVKGFISVQKKDKHLYIDNFYIVEPFRGEGIGKELLKMAIVEEEEMKAITRNDIALKLFLSNGFEVYRENGRYKYLIKK